MFERIHRMMMRIAVMGFYILESIVSFIMLFIINGA